MNRTLNLLVFSLMLPGCDSAQRMKEYYLNNKDSLVEMQTLSQGLADNYAFQMITIRKKREQLEVRFSSESGGVSMYVTPSDLSLIHEFVSDDCDPVVLQMYRTLYQGNTFRQILRLFEAIEPKAISIWHGGIFVALGPTLESKNPNLEGGILMTDEPDPTNRRIVEQIDTNVYLYDDLVY